MKNANQGSSSSSTIDAIGAGAGGIASLLGSLGSSQDAQAAADEFRAGAYAALDELRNRRMADETRIEHQRRMDALAAQAERDAREQRGRLTAAEEASMREMEQRVRDEQAAAQAAGFHMPLWGWLLIGAGGVAATLGVVAVAVR